MIEPLVDLSPVFKELSEDRRIIDPVEQIFGEGAILFEDKINYKPPRVGSGFKMHQDSTYWKRFSRNILSAFVHLDDASEENGCLRKWFPAFIVRAWWSILMMERITR